MAGFDLGSAFGGGVSGAGAGSMFWPWGTVAGSILGFLGGGFGGGQSKPKMKSTLDPEQKKLYGDLNQGVYGSGPLADLFQSDPQALRNMYEETYVNPAMQRFQRQTVPTITGAFRGKGLGGSSYAGNAVAQAGVDVQSGLDAQLAKMLYQSDQDALSRRMSAVDRILGTSTMAQQPPGSNSINRLIEQFGPKALEMLFNKFGG